MRLSIAIPLALLTAPMAVQAWLCVALIHGFSHGPRYHTGGGWTEIYKGIFGMSGEGDYKSLDYSTWGHEDNDVCNRDYGKFGRLNCYRNVEPHDCTYMAEINGIQCRNRCPGDGAQCDDPALHPIFQPFHSRNQAILVCDRYPPPPPPDQHYNEQGTAKRKMRRGLRIGGGEVEVESQVEGKVEASK